MEFIFAIINGYLKTEEEELALIADIKNQPDVVFVAMGSPKARIVDGAYSRRAYGSLPRVRR